MNAGRRGVALGGFMGVGKSTVGARLARHLGLPFVDLDAVLVRRHGPVHDQFADVGEAGFRARERDVVVELCDGVPRVVATGGGTWVDPDNRERLRQHHVLVVLHAELSTLRRRVGSAATRPLWTDAEALLRARRDAYADADLHVDVTAATVDAVVLHIAAALRSS